MFSLFLCDTSTSNKYTVCCIFFIWAVSVANNGQAKKRLSSASRTFNQRKLYDGTFVLFCWFILIVATCHAELHARMRVCLNKFN